MPKINGPASAQESAESLSVTRSRLDFLNSQNLKHFAPWLLLGIVVIAASVFFAVQYAHTKKINKQLTDLKNNPAKIAEDQTKDLINKVGQLIVLPDNEQPTIATVTDLKPLADQPFFKNAQLGFKVLIFTQAKKAILFDPMANKIVEVAPVNIGDNPTEPQVAGSSTSESSQKKTPATNSGSNIKN